MNRKDVYKLITEEREYQNNASDEFHNIADWLIFIEHHLNKAKNHAYDLCSKEAGNEIRKIAALAVACMENHDFCSRSEEEEYKRIQR